MYTLKRTIKWLFRAWSILLLLTLISAHILLVQYSGFDPKATNKVISLLLQIVGGLLVLYSIDSNIGVIKGKNLFSLFTGWLKEFPVFKKSVIFTAHAGTASIAIAVGTVSAVHKTPQSIEEKIEYLQTQIDQIREDITERERKLTVKIDTLATKTTKQLQNSRLELRNMEAKIEDVSVGGIQLQLFGVMLVIYGSITGYLA